MAAQREAEAGALTLRAELDRLRAELQHRDALAAQLQTTQIIATEQASLAGLELARHQVLLQQTRENLKEKKREVKSLNSRVEYSSYQQRRASDSALRLQKELSAREDELKEMRNGWLGITKPAQTTNGAVVETNIRDGARPAFDSREKDSAGMRAEIEALKEENKGLAAELEMAQALIEDQMPEAQRSFLDIDVSENDQEGTPESPTRKITQE